MSGSTQVIWPAGPTVALSVVATSHAAVPLPATDNTNAFWVALLNTGAVPMAVRVSPAGDAAVLPVDGGATGQFVLPASMTVPILLPLPQTPTAPAQITAIGTAAGPSILYATPVVMQR